MRVVLDTSALIYLYDFRRFEELLSVQEVIDEVKDRVTAMKLSSLDLKIVEPSQEALNEIKNIAMKTGDLEKLSLTDLKVLALAKEKDCTIISDDRNVQNVAEKIGVKYVSIFSKAISKLIVWKKYCKNCKKFFGKEKVCDICGEKLIRVPVESKEVSQRTIRETGLRRSS